MPTGQENREALKNLVRNLGMSLFGVADIREVREDFNLGPETRRRFDAAVSLGLRLADAVLDDLVDRPTPLYFHHYRQLNNFLDRAALETATFIQDLGHAALPIAASQIIDWERQRAHVPHKQIGQLAGLGWIGRNNLLVNPLYGSRFRLVTVLTDLPLAVDLAQDFGCGKCRACLTACPAHAIKDTRKEFDHNACYEKLREFRREGLVSQFICGVCVKACRGDVPKRA
jgi:epoxyqueuosine reductase QueG